MSDGTAVGMHSIERIYPPDLDPASPSDQATLHIHLERYEFAARHLGGARVLDMACGCGYGTALLAERHPDKQVTGVDIDPEAIAYAQRHYQLPNLRYVCADAERFDEGQGFDSIVSLETIEHLPDPVRLVANYARLLTAGGRVIASVPITPTLDGNPHHLHDFSRRSFLALFRRHRLRPSEQELEQIQWWQFRGLFSRRPDHAKRHRSEGVGNAVLGYYRRHPTYLFSRLAAMLRYGFSNRYLTCLFVAE
ncbi:MULTISPECIES: class I SAM-dependent methyltransferase [unclassified Pseudomonas]|uniref:class I SAM-dependent methyltransferase n=1 Tax=unclassified Pseudomonas TaxID=196821 RepID=UPI00244836CB|nr:MULTISPECIES: class I SAM-dependent methyltransferase [unclassified Pseudomonas]MDG9930558.1 methyltransferase domain-containing protein [Pseudomonas sp. GD04042]MDH0484829.1 methyltransferase domain-containing protein [Pseudomonas sp. GD04015]MDH0605120.1 methyltransferase domain-containing protein [Pseudomonas sp. GD03869]